MLDPDFKSRLREARSSLSAPPGIAAKAERLTHCLVALLFPGHEAVCESDLRDPIDRYEAECYRLIEELCGAEVADAFFARLPEVWDWCLQDAAAIEAFDPAARSVEEVVVAYPGFFAIVGHRLARELYLLGVPLLPRLIAEVAHRETGIDIHPGASIGRRFVVDHGTGLVIGETAVVGDDVRMYQGVTLGALSVRKEFAGSKRHPTIGDRVILYSHATILGGDTVIGEDSVIGGNVWITESVPAGSVVTRASST